MVCTVIERLQLIAGYFRIVHALQQWVDTSVILAPEIVRNCQYQHGFCKRTFRDYLQDKETLGPSATVPGILTTCWGVDPLGLVEVE